MSDGLAEAPRPTDRGAWRLVAARDFTVRLRDKGFVISTAITLTVLSVFILLRAFGGSDEAPVYRVGLVGDGGVAAATPRAIRVRSRRRARGHDLR